jgi:hypothetical protein
MLVIAVRQAEATDCIRGSVQAREDQHDTGDAAGRDDRVGESERSERPLPRDRPDP